MRDTEGDALAGVFVPIESRIGEVLAVRGRADESQSTFKTDANGRLTLHVLPSRTWILTASHSADHPGRTETVTSPFAGQSRAVHFELAAGGPQWVEVTVESSIPGTGLIELRAERRVGNSRVLPPRLIHAAPSPRGIAAVVRPDESRPNAALLRLPAQNVAREWTIAAQEHATVLVSVEPDTEDIERRVVLDPLAAVYGKVELEPSVTATLRLRPSQASGGASFPVPLDRDGRWVIEGVRPGTPFDVELARSFRPVPTKERRDSLERLRLTRGHSHALAGEVRLAPGERREIRDPRLDAVPVTVVCTFPDGTPLSEGARIHASRDMVPLARGASGSRSADEFLEGERPGPNCESVWIDARGRANLESLTAGVEDPPHV